MTEIKFGTDGWRAVIADEFTFARVKTVVRAIAEFLKERKKEKDGVVIGFDNRFLSEEFAASAAAVFLGENIKVYLCSCPAPTPAVAFAVKHYQSAGAIMFTASHNPARYHGIKFIPHYAGPALPPETDRIGELVHSFLQENQKKGNQGKSISKKDTEIDKYHFVLQKLMEEEKNAKKIGGFRSPKTAFHYPKDADTGEKLLQVICPKEPYLEHLKRIIDVKAIADAGPAVVVDSMHGSGGGYLEDFLLPLGCRVETVRGCRDPLFGGGLPDPAPRNLKELRSQVLELQAEAGLALDGDGDRLGIIDPEGEYISANDLFLLLLEYLVQNRGRRGIVVRTVATTHNLDRLARHYGLRLIETPVGFKYIGQVIREQNALLGGEESGGISMRGHIPEKDGIMAALLFMEMLAVSKSEPAALFQKIAEKVNVLGFKRWDIRTSSTQKAEILNKLKSWQPQEIAGLKVESINRTDGVKVLFEKEKWCLIRSSGTEDLFRLYAEAPDETMLEELRNGIRWELGL